MLDRVTQSSIILLCLCLELIGEALIQCVKVNSLFLQVGLNTFGLLTGVSILLKLLLEISTGSL